MRRLGFALLLLLTSPTWAALDGKQQELEDLRGRIEQLKREIEQASEDKAEVADALQESEVRISDVNRSLRSLRARQRALGRELDTLSADAEQTRSELQKQQARLADLLRQTYLQGGNDALRLLLNGQDPAETARNLAYLRYVGEARNALIGQYRDTLARLDMLEARIREQNENLRQAHEERLGQKRLLEAEKAERKRVLDQLAKQIRTQRREVSTLVRDEQRLARLIERLSRMSAKPAKKKPKAGEGATDVVTDVADASLSNYAFAKLKGRLALPVAGEILSRFGDAREGGGPAWKGVYIRAPIGTEVRAVGNGRVAFADWLRGFGNLLILDHGEGFLSLYSNNESLYKQVGDRVQAGDAIATVGNTGGQEESGLYFEIRHQGRPFDPLSWVKSR